MTAIAPLTLDTGSLAVVKRVEALIGYNVQRIQTNYLSIKS